MNVLFGRIADPPGPEAMAMAPVLRSLVGVEDPQVRQTASILLTRIDPGAPELVALYFACIREGEFPDQNNQWLYGILRPEMIPRLIAGLGDDDPRVRLETARLLNSLVENWRLFLGHRDRAGGVRLNAEQMATRRRLQPLSVQAIHALLAALKDTDDRVRWHATFALGLLEGEAQTVVPILIEMVQHETGRVSADGSINFRPFGDRGQYYFLGPSKKEGDPLRIAAMQALGSFGPDAATAVPLLIRTLHDPEPRIRWFAIEALALIGPTAKAAVPALIEALRSKDVAAAGIIRGIGMFMFGEMDDGPIRLIAAEALGRIGPDAKAAIPDLIAAMGDPDSRVRAEAARALGGIGPDAAAAIPDLVRLLTRSHPAPAAEWAKESLTQIGTPAVPALLEVLRNDDPGACIAAIEALGKLGPRSSPSLPRLIACLHDPSPRVRIAAARTLGEIGPEDAAVIPDLIDAIKDPDDEVSAAACDALARLGKPAVPAVLALNKDDDPDTRKVAVTLLSAMATPVPDWPGAATADSEHPSRAIRAALRSALGDRDGRIRSAPLRPFRRSANAWFRT